jgi:hypothetical protein
MGMLVAMGETDRGIMGGIEMGTGMDIEIGTPTIVTKIMTTITIQMGLLPQNGAKTSRSLRGTTTPVPKSAKAPGRRPPSSGSRTSTIGSSPCSY